MQAIRPKEAKQKGFEQSGNLFRGLAILSPMLGPISRGGVESRHATATEVLSARILKRKARTIISADGTALQGRR